MRNKFIRGASLCFAILCTNAVAGISLNATRVIFNGQDKEASIVVRNEGEQILVQCWLDRGVEISAEELPFAVTPPIGKINAGQRQLLRILYEGQGMPTDRESMFWLNVQEIPQAAAEPNTLQFAVRQRIKVFYRPQGIVGDVTNAPSELQWKLQSAKALTVTNPSRYYVSMVDLKVRNAASRDEITRDAFMLAPGASETLTLSAPAAPESTMTFYTINDYGTREPYKVALQVVEAAKAVPLNP